MTQPVSIVLPSLGDVSLLEANLPPLLEETGRRALGDEVLVVDDTGHAVLAPWLAAHHPEVVLVARDANGGFARALLSGVERARHALVFSMNTDVRVRPGFLDPLVACLQEEQVFAVAPRVLLGGHEERIESLTGLRWERGFVSLHQPGLAGGDVQPILPTPVAFAVGGTCLFRRAEFLAGGGFDALYEPFYWEDIDLCWQAWSAGRRVLYQPASVVEHHHRGTIGKVVPAAVVRAAIEKNRLLFHWKHLHGAELLQHLAALHRLALDAWISDLRDELVWLDLALEQAEEALASRAALGAPRRSFAESLRLSTPS
jgi:GT2 family glycosyltransferase